MINLAFSTNAFKKTTLEDAIAAIAAAGYRGCEIMADVPHAYPPHMDAGRIGGLRSLLARTKLAVSNINAFTLFAAGDTYHPTWLEHDPAKRAVRIEHTLACIDLARGLGAACISLQPGGPTIGTGLARDEAMGRFAEGLRQVLPAARSAGITLAIEPEPGLLLESAAEYLDFKQRHFADEPAVAMNCDIGHLFCVGEDPADVIRRMPEQIAHVHLEDINKERVHQHLVPGQGAIDFTGVFSSLEQVGYKGWVTVELYPYTATAEGVAQQAIQYLKPLIEARN